MSAKDSTPAIFMDSHPEEQDNYLTSWITTIRTNLAIAATGVVERSLVSGNLRLKWYTHDGSVGFKDYPLHDYDLVRNDYCSVLALTEVRRAMVLGHPDQNPYILINGKNPWIDLFKREKKQKEKLLREKRAREAKNVVQEGDFLNIDALIEETEKEEEKRIQLERDAEAKAIEEAIKNRQCPTKVRLADEEEGLLSSHM